MCNNNISINIIINNNNVTLLINNNNIETTNYTTNSELCSIIEHYTTIVNNYVENL